MLFLVLGLLTTAALSSVLLSRHAQAAGFASGNLVIYRVGDGGAPLGSTATAVFLDEYTPSGTFVQSIPMPTAVNGSNRRLTASGSATSEGFLTLSSNGQNVVLTGYDAALGTTGVATTTSAAVNRVVGRVDSTGTIDTTTAISDAFSGGNPRGATGDGGTNFWVVGSNSGVRLVTLGSSGTSTSISTTNTNLRGTNIFNGQLYASSGASSPRMGTVGTGTPTTSGQTIANLPSFPVTGAITGFFFADLNAGVTGVDTLYVADDSASQVQKYSLVGGNWVANGSISVASARGLTGSVQGTTVTLFGTLGSTGGTLYKLTDASGYNATISGTTTTIASAGTNKAFRGVAFAPSSGTPTPTPSPSPSNPSGVGAANPSTVQAGNSTLLTVTVTPGANPTSTGLAVSANLSSIGGSSTQQFFDDGTHGDLVAGNNVFSFQATVSPATSTGAKSLPATITDAQSRSGSASIALTVTAASTAPTGTGSASPNSLLAGNSTLLTVTVTNGTNPTSTGLSVTGDLSSIGGSGSQQFFDDGTHGDASIGDNIFSFQATVSLSTTPGSKSLPITISDAQARSSSTSISLTVQPPPPPTTIKVSQVYGGGGNSGSTYTNDFIEIFNQGPTTIDVTNWSVQYNSAGATGTWQVTNLCPVASTCTVAPGHYYLVQESQGAGGTTSLPTPDATGVIMMSGTSAKVALVAGTAALTGCPTGGAVVDLVGYGPSANCFEMSPTTSNLSATTAAVRRGNGCVDTDNNASDFVTIGPIPRNSASPFDSCGGDPTQPSGLGIASPASVDPASTSLLTVNVTPATTPPSTGLGVSGDLTSIGGSASQQFYDDGTNGDSLAGDNVFSYRATVGAFIPTGVKNIVTTITDAQGRTATAPITMTVQSPTCGVERWSVKTGTDPDAGQVDLNNPVHTTVADLGAIPAPPDPPGPPLNARLAPTETTVYVVNATMTLYKKETDVDYHIILQDDTGHTMIAEIPCPCCVGLSSPFAAGIANARSKFDARFTATSFFQTANIPVQITGVGFFDFIHGQMGVAPNGIELHPVLDIKFTANTSTTLMSSANPSQYGQSVGITATVTNGGISTPTGTVNFFDNGTPLGSGSLDATGHATFNTNTLSVSSHPITAHYGGDGTSATSTSAVLTQEVTKADQTINFAPLAGKTYGDPPFNVSANASSGLTVSFQILSGPATISGNTVTITGAGNVVVKASQAGDGNYNPAPDAQQSFSVAQAAATINVNGYTGVYDGNAHGATGSATGVNGEDLTGLLNLGASFTDVPGGTAHWTFAGNTNYAPASGNAAINITQATATITVNGYTGVYDGNPHGATGSATGVNGEDLTGLLNLGASFTNVPGGPAHWTFTGNVNYASASGDAAITITKASTTTTVTCPASETYTGAPLTPCSVRVTGANLSLTPAANYANNTNVGTATASYTYAGDSNHDGSSDSKNFEITKASSSTTVTCPASETYTGAALTPCSVTVTGANLSLTPAANYANNTNVGTATASYTYAGDSNHDGSSDSKNFEITKANATISVTPYSVTYDGNPHTATGTATGVNGESLSGLDLSGTTHTNAGAYNGDAWTFTDVTGNYNNASGTVDDSISKASASITINGYSGVYDGAAHGATGSATGVKGENLTSLLNLGATFTNVPGGTAHWTFAGNTNYGPASGDATITITKATPTITWNNPADIVYGTTLSSTQLNATANAPGTFGYTPGSGTLLNAGSAQPLLASFTPTDTTDYNPTSKSVQINVLKATPSFSNLSSPVITYGTVSTNLSGKISFGLLIPTGSVAITLNSVTQNAAIQAGGSFSSAFATGSLAPGSYSIAYSYGGDSNFNSASGSGTLTVGYGIVALYDQTKVHQSGSTIPIKLGITDANGNNLSSANTVVTAVGIALILTSVNRPVQDSGNANPDNNFRFDGGQYIFNLKTTGLATGVYNLYFKVGNDPTLHTVQFQIK